MGTKDLSFVKCCWITPDGKIHLVTVPQNHDKELPSFYDTVGDCEKYCIRISCSFGFDAPISEISVPNHCTDRQKVTLNDIDNSGANLTAVRFYVVGNMPTNFLEVLDY